MKKLLLLFAFFTISICNAQVNSLELDELYRGDNIAMSYSPMDGLGFGGTVSIHGNKFSGRIAVQTGVGCATKSLCRILFPEGNPFDTDTLIVMLFPNDNQFFQVVPQGVEGNGFEIYAKDNWSDSTSYEFNYLIIAKQ